jgi:D-arabinose 1-dehydrogenase-like Zn-dependent alcohol dehydrogenase
VFEDSGQIAECGEAAKVTATGGDKEFNEVLILKAINCQHCESCRSGGFGKRTRGGCDENQRRP